MSRRLLFVLQAVVIPLGLTLLGPGASYAQPPENGADREVPVYQRHSSDWRGHDRRKFDRRFDRRYQWQSPHVNSGWFQRPYPYHLDYYKMRYGGSYAPYFGNLYGPPQVVTAPPYFGTYGGFEYLNPGDGAFGVPYSAAPNGLAPGGELLDDPAQQAAPPANDELPAP